MSDLDKLNERIELLRRLLAFYPPTDSARAIACADLASSLHECYQRTGQASLLDEAITFDREVLALRPHGHPNRVEACSNLAVSLQHLYERTGDTEPLDQAIALQREALALPYRRHHNYPTCCGNLACTLQHRYTQTGNTILLHEAIKLHYIALVMRPPKHPDCALGCRNLGDSLRILYKLTRNPDVLDIAIILERLSVSLLPKHHPDRAPHCRNLSISLSTLSHSHSPSDPVLDEAISWAREALALLPHEHYDRAKFITNLLFMLGSQSGKNRVDDLATYNERVELAREAIGCSPPSRRYVALFALFRIELQSDNPHFSATHAIDTLSRGFDAMPDDPRRFVRNMNRCLKLVLCRGNPTPEDAPLLLDLYMKLIDLVSRIIGFSSNVESQLEFIKSARWLESIARAVAYLSGRRAQAVELLDHTQGIIWAQALHQRDPQIRELPERLAVELETLLHAVSNPTMDTDPFASTSSFSGYHSLQDIRDVQNSRIQAILTEVRTIPGKERFMLGNTYADLRETAREHPVVLLVDARAFVYALIISNSSDIDPHLLSLDIPARHLTALHKAATCVGLRNGQPTDSSNRNEDGTRLGRSKRWFTMKKTFAVLSDLWNYVVKPIFDHLELQPVTGLARPRLHWCPTGIFASLPLHAAGIYEGPAHRRTCCFDYVVSTYTPTLSALLRAQKASLVTAPARMSMLAIAEDCAAAESMDTLKEVSDELAHIEKAAKACRMDCAVETISSGATVDRVTNRIQHANFVHLACHGTQDLDSALKSGFHLSDGMLTISKLMTINLDQAWFAYLSACETAKGDEAQPDQVVHLAAAMLHAGFKNVVATMWSMADMDGPDMAQWFYEELFSREVIDTDAIARALDTAVGKLRKKHPLLPQRWAVYIHMGA